MRSWYEFGYNGFPTGEQRRRFYRQRDDPCDSEEERDYDDETNDRPIFYYPLRASEEGSRSSYDSGFSDSSASSCASNEEGSTRANDAFDPVHRTTRRHRKRASRISPADATVRCVLHSTLYEDMPAWYGATSVPLVPSSALLPATDMITLQHGGAPCASPFATSNQVSLWHWSPTPPSPLDSLAKDEASGGLRCARVRDDEALLARVRWDRLHPVLRLARSSAARLPARIGHCAVSLAAVDSSLLQYFLTDHHSDRHQTATTVTDPASTGGVSTGLQSHADTVLDLVADQEMEVHASLVVGGAAQLVDAASSGGPSCGRHNTSSSSSPWSLGVSTVTPRDDASSTTGPNLDGAVIPHSGVLSHPALCITLLAKETPTAAASTRLRGHTIVLPLDTPSASVAAPRAFATLTPWADPRAEAVAVCSFAYLGGTENGRDPLAFLELEVLRLHLETWAWSCSPVTTYGAKPAPRFGHSANTVDDGQHLLLFGGVGMGHVYLNDLHVLDVRTRVWREVFLPCSLAVPRRAFHVSAVLTSTSAAPADERRNAAAPLPSKSRPRLSAFTQQARAALQHGGACATSMVHCGATGGGEGRSAAASEAATGSVVNGMGDIDDANDGADVDDDADVWSSAVTTAQSRCTLVLLGGEGDGGRPVAASWTCALRNSKWQQLSFPLRTLPHFYHVARSVGDGVVAAGVARARRQLSRTDFRVAVESLLDRTARATFGGTSGALSSSASDTAYVTACHGSLGQLLVCPRSAQGAERLLVVGGSRGPPVTVATQLEVIGSHLQDTASLWLLAVQQQGLLSANLQERVPQLSHFLFHSNGALAKAVGSAFHAGAVEEVERQRRALSAADARSNRLISESVLDGQLTEWMRLARKRLRDSD